jgi:O-acetyl-ADP-ribose deacetylase (regulator of RNase III)
VIRALVDDLASMEADALVRPANVTLEPISHALRSLEMAGGPEFLKQIQVPTRLAVGAAVVTAAGDLPTEFVIHAVLCSEDEPVTPSGVRLAVTSVLQRAADWEFATLTMPLLGIGPGNLTLESAAQILVDVLTTTLPRATYPREVCIVVESEEERELVDAYIRSLSTQ